MAWFDLSSRGRATAAALATLVFVSTFPFPASLIGGEAGSAPKSIISLLTERSPGERRAGELLGTKTSAAVGTTNAAAGLAPGEGPAEQRALGKIFSPADFAMLSGEVVPDLLREPFITPLEVLPVGSIPELGSSDIVDTAPIPLTGAILPASLLAGGGGGGIGGGSGSDVITPDVVVPQVPTPVFEAAPSVSAVPEPQTWALMLIGMAACGAAMRRRRPIAIMAPSL